MLRLNSIFKSGIKLSKESSPHIKITEKSIEGLNKNRNISLDFSNTPLKQNKKIIKRNKRTNSFNSLIINQTESGIYPPYPYMSGFNPTFNHKLIINKNYSGLKGNFKQKNKSINLKKGIFNLNKPKLPISKKNSKKKSKRNFLNSYFINPSNIHISFNTVGNNFQFEQNPKQNKNNNILKTDLYHNNNFNYNNNKLLNTSEINKSIHALHKTRSTKKFNFNNEIYNIINSTSEEYQKILLNEFKLFLNVFIKIKKNKNDEIIINERDIPELQKGGLLGNILTENYKIKKKNEELELKLDYVCKELEEIKNDKKDIRKQLENKDNIISEMNLKINSFNQEFTKIQNIIKNINKNKNSNNNLILKKEETISNKSSLNDLDNISLGNNINIDIEAYKSALNKNNKNMTKNKSEKNIKANAKSKKVAGLSFGSKVGSYNFNDEFLKDYENFSESWRKEVDKMLQRRGGNIKKIPEIKINTDMNK